MTYRHNHKRNLLSHGAFPQAITVKNQSNKTHSFVFVARWIGRVRGKISNTIGDYILVFRREKAKREKVKSKNDKILHTVTFFLRWRLSNFCLISFNLVARRFLMVPLLLLLFIVLWILGMRTYPPKRGWPLFSVIHKILSISTTWRRLEQPQVWHIGDIQAAGVAKRASLNK